MLKKQGFTLAEVLITIGILGVIAAVTLPALNTNIVKSQLEVQTRKFYTQFTKAMDLYKVDSETNKITGMDFNTSEFARKYFNISKQCLEATDCYAAQYQTVDNKMAKKSSAWFNKDCTYELADGTVFTLDPINNESPSSLIFDVNGKKGPNKIGYDLWNVSVFYDGSVDESGVTPEIRKNYPGERLESIVEARYQGCLKGNSYGGCFGHFKRNGFKFDY